MYWCIMHFRINIQIGRTPTFLAAMITFWFFQRRFLTLYHDIFLYMYLRTSWSAVTVNEVLFICPAIASYQNTSVSRKDIPTSDAPTTTIRALMVTWREIQKEGLHCVLLKSLTLFSCKRVEKFRAKYWITEKNVVPSGNTNKNILIKQSNQ